MAVAGGYEPKAYVSDGSLSPRTLEWPLIDPAHLIITVEDQPRTLNVHYEINGLFPAQQIVPLAGYATSGQTVRYRRQTTAQQDYRINSQALDRAQLEGTLDRNAMVAQELAATLDRAPLAPIGGAGAGLFPTPDGEGGWRFDPSGPGAAGPAGPTFLTLAAFRAAPLTNQRQSLKDPAYPPGDYFLETENAPYVEKLPHVIAADALDLSVGAWVRQRLGRVTYQRDAAGAVERDGQEAVAALGATPQDFDATGDGVTDDTAAIVDVVSAGGGVLPDGIYAIARGTDIGSRLRGPGVLAKGDTVWPLNDTEAGVNSIETLRAGDMDQLRAALASGAVKIAIVGDSNWEGLSQTAFGESIPAQLIRAIRASVPGVTIEVGNFSISGRGWGELNAPTYVGTASPSYDPAANFNQPAGGIGPIPEATLWPGGTTPGDTWLDHVEAFAPDLLMAGLGTNDPDPYGMWGAARNVLANRVATWTKVPSVVLVTPPQPHRVAGAAVQLDIEGNSHALRALADELGHTLVDVNRRSWAVRGVDIVEQRFANFLTFADSADWAVQAGAMPALAGTTATYTSAGAVYRPVLHRDFVGRVDGTLAGSTYYDLHFRKNPADLTECYHAIVQGGASPQVLLRWGGSGIASSALTPGATAFKMVVEARGAVIVIKVDDGSGMVERIRAYDTRWIAEGYREGYMGLEASAGVTLTNCVAYLGHDRQLGPLIFTDEELWGGVNDFTSNPWSLCGNANNHPSQIGITQLYMKAFAPFFALLKGLSSFVYPPAVIEDPVTDTTTAIAAADYLDISINGSNSSAGSMMVGTGLNASLGGCRVINVTNPATPVAIRLLRNGATMIQVDVTVPMRGAWLFRGDGHVSNNAGTLRHGLSASAIRVAP